jgi:hypothetical protein
MCRRSNSLPEANELPASITEKINLTPVRSIREALAAALLLKE